MWRQLHLSVARRSASWLFGTKLAASGLRALGLPTAGGAGLKSVEGNSLLDAFIKVPEAGSPEANAVATLKGGHRLFVAGKWQDPSRG